MPGDTEFRDLGDKDAYDVLGVPRNATDEQIQHEYRVLMEIWHPDSKRKGSQARELAEDRAKELNVARMYLTEDRRAYDAYLARRDRGRRNVARPAGPGTPARPGAPAGARDPWDEFVPGGRPQPAPGPIWRARPGRPGARTPAAFSGWRTTARFLAGLVIAVILWLIGTSLFFIIFDAVEGQRMHHLGTRLTLFALGCNLVIFLGCVTAPLLMFRRRRKRRAAAAR